MAQCFPLKTPLVEQFTSVLLGLLVHIPFQLMHKTLALRVQTIHRLIYRVALYAQGIGDRKAVCLPVECPSVRPSNGRIVTKRKHLAKKVQFD